MWIVTTDVFCRGFMPYLYVYTGNIVIVSWYVYRSTTQRYDFEMAKNIRRERDMKAMYIEAWLALVLTCPGY